MSDDAATKIPGQLFEADERARATHERLPRLEPLANAIERSAVAAGVPHATVVAARRGAQLEPVEVRLERERVQRAEARALAEAQRIETAFDATRISVRASVRTALLEGRLDEELAKLDPDPHARDAVDAVETWLGDRDAQALAIIGDMGRGKTVASAVAALAMVRKRRSVLRCVEPELVTWAHVPTSAFAERFAVAINVDLLIVDELGTALGAAERSRAALFRALDARIPRGLRTLMLSNHGADTPARKFTEREAIGEFGQAYGGRFLDRMREIGSICVVKGPSLRGRS